MSTQSNDDLCKHITLIRRIVAPMGRRMGYSPDDIDDVAQEVAIKCWSYSQAHAGQLPSEGETVNIARWKTIDRARTEKRSLLRTAEPFVDHLTCPAARPTRNRSAESKVQHLLGLLRPDAQELIRRHHLWGESPTEIAKSRGVNPNSVYLSLRRAMKKLESTGSSKCNQEQ